ncbi:16880_t:CDS:2 [Racocetra persica]|uniref:16880_t:CDS:1 n=1 Tax=Racocetra persica TaxID=160502 RepID=A0ACA9L8C8_9GLOM|nr:16880_t:CDS:2 [Racocetra persica]
MLIFPILCALYASSVWILITCSERTGQSRIIDDDDDGIDFEENRVLFDEEEEFIKAELDTFNSNSNSDSA